MASCWICLDEGADQYGKPPVRDCSCRGEDAGFAHVSCIVDYARRKSSEANRPSDFMAPWTDCSHCKQDYQNQLRFDLLYQFERFVEEQYPGCNWRHLAVQKRLLTAVATSAEISTEKREEIIDSTLSIIDHLSIHTDPYIEILKASALNTIGQIRLGQEDLTEDEAKKCLGYLEEGRKVGELVGHAGGIADSEATIAYYKARCIERFGAQEAFGELESLEQMIERQRNAYQLVLEEDREIASLVPGTNLAYSLRNANRTIEARRLLKTLIVISTQHHGREHGNTKLLEQKLANCKIQCECVLLRSLGLLLFQATGYEDNKYVLRGPIGVTEDKMQTLKVDPNDVILKPNGTPVVCHGLKNKAAYSEWQDRRHQVV